MIRIVNKAPRKTILLKHHASFNVFQLSKCLLCIHSCVFNSLKKIKYCLIFAEFKPLTKKRTLKLGPRDRRQCLKHERQDSLLTSSLGTRALGVCPEGGTALGLEEISGNKTNSALAGETTGKGIQ